MRTPGEDLDLVFGFLATERVIHSAADVASARHCSTVPSEEAEDNVMLVQLAPHVAFDLAQLKRNLFASSSCGVCGKATIEAAMSTGAALSCDLTLPASLLYGLPAQMRARQATFEATGGLHAAALFDAAGSLLVLREDVGRHNAVDKVVGAALRAGTLGREPQLLLVSGRISFEIVQKAAAAGVPFVLGVSAPTSLAARFADALGVTVVGFLRGQSLNVYSRQDRIVPG